ncbi:MAG: hypothetical protein RBR71_06110 [Gudongella sp.]|nr:hypothetical protein [Gudongella sp.]
MNIRELETLNDINIDKEYTELLDILEKTNPCEQRYINEEDLFIVLYKQRINILNFTKLFPLYINATIVGLPISLSEKGYFGDEKRVEDYINSIKGLAIVLNADKPFSAYGKTLSTFRFYNRFASFDEYLECLRSPYRRRILLALKRRKELQIRKAVFTDKHYSLYKSVLNRSKYPLESMPLQFFENWDSEIYEFLSLEDELLGFVQLKQIGDKLYFIFCGFEKENIKRYDIYINMLIWIIEVGIKKGVTEIDFGQTSEETKLKLGCEEREKYLYINHSNIVLDKIIKFFLPRFSYKGYEIEHRVFKR